MFYRLTMLLLGFWLTFWSVSVSADKLQLTIESAKGKPKGVVVIQLLTDVAPNHVARIKLLTDEGKYNGVTFHRAIRGFMAQTGDVKYGNSKNFDANNAGKGGSDYEDLKAELSDIPFTPGIVGMARSRYINSANSQFFIMTEIHSGLNGSYTVFGKVVEGLDVVRSIKTGPQSQGGQVNKPDVIKEAVILGP